LDAPRFGGVAGTLCSDLFPPNSSLLVLLVHFGCHPSRCASPERLRGWRAAHRRRIEEHGPLHILEGFCFANRRFGQLFNPLVHGGGRGQQPGLVLSTLRPHWLHCRLAICAG